MTKRYGQYDNIQTKALNIGGTEVTATAAELNIMDGVTATAAELNIMDTVTATAAELNTLADVTAGTAKASAAAVLGTNKNLDEFHTAALYLGAAAGTLITSTAAELNKLDDVSVTAAEMDQRALTATLTLASAGQVYIVSPYTGNVTAVYSVINGSLTTADEVLTVKTAAGTAGTITIAQSGSAAGDIDSLVPTENNAIAAGAAIEIETGGQNETASICTLTVLIDIT